jgi:hypothetical protein
MVYTLRITWLKDFVHRRESSFRNVVFYSSSEYYISS